MEILIRKKGEGKGKWTQVKEHKFENESALQNILYNSPEIIPIEKLGENLLQPIVFIKEAGLPGSGNTDLIGIDEQGGITIIECKLAVNREIRRQVIGQVLEYAAYLWQMTYDQFENVCRKAEGWEDNLAHIIGGKIEKVEEEWSEDNFIDNVASGLEAGDFRLIIAVDALNDELRRIIEFVNSRGEDSPQIYALEMRQFETPEHQMLIPEVFGYKPRPHREHGGRIQSTEENFFEDAKKRCPSEVVLAMDDLYKFCKNNLGYIGWGTGVDRRSFIFHGIKRGLSIFTLYSDGGVYIHFRKELSG